MNVTRDARRVNRKNEVKLIRQQTYSTGLKEVTMRPPGGLVSSARAAEELLRIEQPLRHPFFDKRVLTAGLEVWR